MEDLTKEEWITLGKIIGLCGIGIIGLIMLFMSIKFIGVGERAIVFNKFSGQIEKYLDSGINFVNPITKRVKVYNLKVTKEQYEMIGLSADSQSIKLAIVVNYKLKANELDKIYKNVQGRIEDTLIYNAIIDTTKAELGKFRIDDIAKNRESLKKEVEEALRERMNSNFVDIMNVSITDVDYSDAYEASIEAKLVAEQRALEAKNKKEQVRYESEAKAIENEKMATSVTPLVLKQKWIEKWNGALPSVMTAENASMLLNMN